ncbi:MAG: long-chain fatty acid--CoA ligase [Bacteroidetes bacterium]|nr:long-chain fatty acid--CoA ligase [Bacteroidota bacterium]
MEVKRLFDILEFNKQSYNVDDALAAKENGKWIKYSTEDVYNNCTFLAYGLMSIGVQKNDNIALIANNRPEWVFADYAMQMSGGISVPIYPTISDNDLKFIFNDAQIKFAFVSSKELYDKVSAIKSEVPSLKEIITFNKVDGAKNWKDILELGKKEQNTAKMNEMKASIKESDLATILYTSGTTGNPKGVMLSHKNLVSQVKSVKKCMPIVPGDKALSFLPLNHVYERMLEYNYQSLGISIYFAESLETIADNLKEVKPHVFTTVPRLLEKVYDKIVAKGEDLTGIKRTLFFWALNLGLKYELDGKNGAWYEFQLKIARKLIFSKWQEALGGNIKTIVSGGAALQERLARVFWGAGIPVLEGYGLTETSPVIAVNYLDKGCTKFGTVGTVIDGCEVKIAEDGEILVKGPNIMMGYYKRPEATAEVIVNGWFHTGDIGIFVEGKYLKITDRKKEIFKTSGGKYIAPQMIENKLKESPYIEQAMVVGENEKFASALIVPSFINLKDYFSKKGKSFSSNEELIKDSEVNELIKSHINQMNQTLAQYESIKKFELLPREWSIDNGEMTPKLSLKRKIITAANKSLIEGMYK